MSCASALLLEVSKSSFCRFSIFLLTVRLSCFGCVRARIYWYRAIASLAGSAPALKRTDGRHDVARYFDGMAHAAEPCFSETALGGTISAIGFPRRRIRTGTPVLRTSASTARQVALNVEMFIPVMLDADHVQRPRSIPANDKIA
jgi:hypothetical protein